VGRRRWGSCLQASSAISISPSARKPSP
jgi:hypothetical protein